MNSIKRLAGQTAIYGLSSIVGRLINYLLVPLHTYVFDPGNYGVVTELYAYIVFFLVLLTYGMETTFFRFSEKDYHYKKVFTSIIIPLFLFIAFFIFIIHLFSYDIADLLGYYDHSEYIRWFALIVGIDAFSNIPFAKLRKENRALTFVKVKLINIGINFFFNFFFLVILPNLHHLEFIDIARIDTVHVKYVFISNLIASILTLIILAPEVFNNPFYFNPKLFKKMFLYATPLVVAGLAGMVNEFLDRILLKHLLVPPEGVENSRDYIMSQIGIYGANYKLAIFMTLFIQMFRYAAEPFIFSSYRQENPRNLYALIMKLFVVTGILIFLGVTMYIDLIKLIIDNAYHEGLHVVPVLLIANLFLGINFNLAFWYKLKEKTQYGAYITLIGAGITVLFNFLLVPEIGYTGAAWATLICYISMVFINYFVGKRHYLIPYDLKNIFFYIGFSLFLFGVSHFIPESNVFVYYGLRSLIIIIFVLVFYYKEKSLIHDLVKK